MKVQYIKKYPSKVFKKVKQEDGTYELEKISNPIFQRTSNEKKGVLFADVQDDKIIIGFSLCHSKHDIFDHVDPVYVEGKDGKINVIAKKAPGLGLEIAKDRADKWKEKHTYDVINKLDDYPPVNCPSVKIPQTIASYLPDFLIGCMKYYKDKPLVDWARNFVVEKVQSDQEEKAI